MTVYTVTTWVNNTTPAISAANLQKIEDAINTAHAEIDSHASNHTNGTDDIQNATAAQKGLATAIQITKLDGIEALADVTDAINIASSIVGVVDKATPVDADSIGLIDSAATNSLKELTWANIKATLKAYFDTLYNLYSHPAGDGNLHVIATSTINDGKVLTAGATAGALSWTAAGAGSVTSVTGTAPVVSSGGATPAISIPAATNAAAGHATAAQITKLEGIASNAIANLVEDTTPQLGGDLDTNSKNINAINQTNAIENESKLLQTEDIFSDFVVTGLLPATSTDLISDISAGHAYVTGVRVNKVATST